MLICNNKGMALLLTIMVVSLLVTITLQFNRNMRYNLFASATTKDIVILEAVAHSGINIALSLLEKDRGEQKFDTLADPWNTLQDESFTPLFDDGSLALAINDLSGRFQINSLVQLQEKGEEKENSEQQGENEKKEEKKSQLNLELESRNILWRLLRQDIFGLEDSEAREIIDSLVDWIDAGDDGWKEEHGAESSYYQSLDPPYSCKNGPIDFIEELLLVKGITPELFYGTKDTEGLARFLTAHGRDGRININTAPPQLLQALNEHISKEDAEDMVDFRDNEENAALLARSSWYKEVLSPDVVMPEEALTTVSSYFRITSSGSYDTMLRQVSAVVKREKEGIRIVKWKAE